MRCHVTLCNMYSYQITNRSSLLIVLNWIRNMEGEMKGKRLPGLHQVGREVREVPTGERQLEGYLLLYINTFVQNDAV